MSKTAQKLIDYCDAILCNSEFTVDEIMETDTGHTLQPAKEPGFIVVECRRAINQHHHRVCVPRTWITCPMRGLKVAIGYPAEDEDSIAKRVRKREPADNNWQSYIGEIQFESESYEEALGYLQALCGGSTEQIEENSNEKPNDEADGNLQPICGRNSKQIEDNSNEKTNEDAVACLQTMFGENSKQIKNNSNRKPNEDAVAYFITLLGGNGQRIEDNSNQIKAVTDPKTPLKLKIKLNQKSEEKKQSEKKYHKIHSKGKVHKHRHMKQLTLTNNINKRSSPNFADTRVGTEPCMRRQSNCQSSEISPKSLVSEIRNSVQSAPETHFKISNNNSYSFKKIVSESLDAEKENSNVMLPEDQELVEDMYTNIMRHVQYMKTTALEMKKSHLIVMEHKAILDNIVAKYRIPLPPTTAIEREEENLQDDEKENQDDDVLENEAQAIIDPVNEENERNDDQLEEENWQDTERETQDDDIIENDVQVTEENDKASEVFEETKNTEILESDLNNQIIYTDDESIEDLVTSSLKVVKFKGIPIGKDNDIRTLKHPRPGKGLIKIGRHSHFYISAAGLEKAKHTSRDVKQFARELFKEVFTDRALGTGSMTGFNKRPVLHYEARTVLQNYAMKYGQDKGWDRIEPMELESNLRRFLCNNRRHYPSKEAKRKVSNRSLKPQRAKRAMPTRLHLERPAQTVRALLQNLQNMQTRMKKKC